MHPRFIHLITIVLCLLIIADYKYAPQKVMTDEVVWVECNLPRRRSTKPRVILEGKKSSYDLPLPHCVSLSEGDLVVFTKSAITGSLSTITIPSTAGPLTYEISFLGGRRFGFYTWILIMITLVFFVFYNRIGNHVGRIRMVYFLLICSVALFVEHVFNLF